MFQWSNKDRKQNRQVDPDELCKRTRPFKEDGVHLNGPSIVTFGRLLQYYVNRRDQH